MVQIFPWLKIFQTSLIFTFLCLKSITIIRDKEKQKLNWFEKFLTKEKFKPQHNIIHIMYFFGVNDVVAVVVVCKEIVLSLKWLP